MLQLCKKKEKKHKNNLVTMTRHGKKQKDWISCHYLMLMSRLMTRTFKGSRTIAEDGHQLREEWPFWQYSDTMKECSQERKSQEYLCCLLFLFNGSLLFIIIFEFSCLLLWFISEGLSELYIITNSFSGYEWLNTIINYKCNCDGIITNTLWGFLFALISTLQIEIKYAIVTRVLAQVLENTWVVQ